MPDAGDRWGDWHPTYVSHRLSDVSFPWAIGKGWAHDLFLTEETTHEALKGMFDDPVWYARVRRETADPLIRLDELSGDVDQAWGWDERNGCWPLDVYREHWEGTTWSYHLDPEVTRADAVRHSPGGIPYVAPEVVLLVKATTMRPKDKKGSSACFRTSMRRPVRG